MTNINELVLLPSVTFPPTFVPTSQVEVYYSQVPSQGNAQPCEQYRKCSAGSATK